ncbi:MAG: hypothetical protein DLM59_05125 [Pseudonocardiales bacterium]|nr:MAG: hypothetical protein DLM59_05125 [Pseudonocardiales bacterium]
MNYTPPFAEPYGGSAVATRWPHRVVEVLDLRLARVSDLPWCTLAVSVPIPGEGDLLFIAATMSWRLDAESARERQAVALTDLDPVTARRCPVSSPATSTPVRTRPASAT